MITTTSSNYTHQVCFACAKTLYCSIADLWEPQAEYGWCTHSNELDSVQTLPYDKNSWHRCARKTL